MRSRRQVTEPAARNPHMELRLPSPCLVVLVGPAGAGKTTWALKTFGETEVVSSDRLRSMVGAGEDDQQASKPAFDVLELIVAERMRRRLTTVVDTLGYDQESRRRWVGLARAARLPAFAVVFDTPPPVIEQRNTRRRRSIPKGVLTRQIRRLASVIEELADDGFDGVHLEQPVSVVTASISREAISGPSPARPSGGHSFGLMVNRFDWSVDRRALPDLLRSIAQRAEQAGFRDLWVMDHFRQIPQVGRSWEDMPEAYTMLPFLAAHTSRIRLGALVSGITHRHPVVLGRMIATLDVLSGGRANLGLGVAWDEEEHRGYGLDFPATARRYDLLEDTLRMLPLLWGKGSPSFEGKILSADALSCYPRPIQDPLPILVGGSGEKRTLPLAARHAHACNLFGRPEVIARKVAVLREHCVDAGRDPGELEVTHLVNAMTAADPMSLRERIDAMRGRNVTAEAYAAKFRAGTVGDQIHRLGAYAEAGADHSIVVLPDAHLPGSIEAFAGVITGLGGGAGPPGPAPHDRAGDHPPEGVEDGGLNGGT